MAYENRKYVIINASEVSSVDFSQVIETSADTLRYKLDNSQICLSGFSQGCMISINIGLTSKEDFNCVVGFSGKIINKDNLSKRISSNTRMLLLHGDLDTIVQPDNLLDAKDFLLRNKIEVETTMISNCGHHIPIKASSIALNYLKKNFFN